MPWRAGALAHGDGDGERPQVLGLHSWCSLRPCCGLVGGRYCASLSGSRALQGPARGVGGWSGHVVGGAGGGRDDPGWPSGSCRPSGDPGLHSGAEPDLHLQTRLVLHAAEAGRVPTVCNPEQVPPGLRRGQTRYGGRASSPQGPPGPLLRGCQRDSPGIMGSGGQVLATQPAVQPSPSRSFLQHAGLGTYCVLSLGGGPEWDQLCVCARTYMLTCVFQEAEVQTEVRRPLRLLPERPC